MKNLAGFDTNAPPRPVPHPQVAGHRTGFGNPVWLETHPPAESTAPPVQASKRGLWPGLARPRLHACARTGHRTACPHLLLKASASARGPGRTAHPLQVLLEAALAAVVCRPCSTPRFAPHAAPAPSPAPAAAAAACAAAQALLDAGATLRGKTHMDELAYSLNGENAHYGTPVNPAAPGRIPGGSSSGSAVRLGAWGLGLGGLGFGGAATALARAGAARRAGAAVQSLEGAGGGAWQGGGA